MASKGIQNWEQSEKLTNRLKTLLEGYADGFSVPKEMIQNADDAGATCVRFMYDERKNLNFQNDLFYPEMRECMGPAFWVYNDKVFSEDDLKNIISLSSSYKQDDSSKVGKFGHGFCSVYNLTDIPSFVSEQNAIIFDPHSKYLDEGSLGKRIILNDLDDEEIVGIRNLLKPYEGVFGFKTMETENKFKPFSGTLFRLPLRTQPSEICPKPYTKQEITELFDIFIRDAGNLLLFTQHVKSIELFHLPADVQEPNQAKLIFSVCRSVEKIITNVPDLLPLKCPVLSYMSAEMSRVVNGEKSEIEEMKLSLVQNINVKVTADARKICNVHETIVKSKWLIAWAAGTKASMEMAKKCLLKGTLPLGSVAALLSDDGNYLEPDLLANAPFGFYRHGHLFCFQPLPVQTPLQVHINGSFAVALDRQKLCSRNEDNKDILRSQWNENLLSDAICSAYLLLLNSLKHLNLNPRSDFHLLWPDLQSFSEKDEHHYLLCLVKTLFNNITTQNIEVFKHWETWSSFDRCCFLDPLFQKVPAGRKLYLSALDTTLKFSKQTDKIFTDLPTNLMNCLQIFGDLNKSNIYSTDWFFEEIFFPNISSGYWYGLEETRDNLVCFALDNLNDLLIELIRSCPCISTEPHGNLRKPSDLIHPECQIRPLFSDEDERFIRKSNPIVQSDNRLNRLDMIGMIKKDVPHDLIIDRAHSILGLSKICSRCALGRCVDFLKYLSHEYVEDRLSDEILRDLKEIEFLPVLAQPKQWPFEWNRFQHKNEMLRNSCKIHKEGIQRKVKFQCPKKLYFPRTKYLVCITEQMVDDNLLSSNRIDDQLLSDLGVQGLNDEQIPTQTVVNQLLHLCKTVTETQHRNLLKDVCHNIYKYLNERLTGSQMDMSDDNEVLTAELAKLQHQSVLLIHDRFISSGKLAFNLSEDCHPYLYGVNDDSICAYRTFLRTVGVKEHFIAEEFLRALLESQTESMNTKLEQSHLQLVLNLTQMLTDALQKEHLHLNDILVGNKLLLPDENGVIYPVEMLCIKGNCDMKTLENIKYVHPALTKHKLELLGIKSQVLQELMEDTKELSALGEESLPFGPSQDITTRIKSLLSGYPCDSGIFKELIQNADDAGATEILFVKDFRYHSAEKVFNSKWRSLQGPALCVYNDTEFTREDIVGIQNVGIGTKGDDPTKTGQFGVGFNSVYHLTDVPSLLTRGPNVDTNETLCIFDPHCTFVPGATKEKPGRRFVNLEKWKLSYPDVFSCYDKQLLKETGTVFRFPLRDEEMTSKSELVSKKKKLVGEEKVTKMLSKFKDEIFDTLLFLKNVKKISVFDISDGTLKEEYTVQANIENEGQVLQNEFFSDVIAMTQKMKEKTLEITSIKEKTVNYVINLKDTDGKQESWLIAQKTGFSEVDDNQTDIIQDAYREDEKLKLFPIGGVAVLLKINQSSISSPRKEFRAFTFLPLPIKTGLPVHINGHFALDHEARRNLWREDDKGYRTVWNRKIMRDIIAPAYVSAIQDVKRRFGFYDGNQLDIKNATNSKREFHAIFPSLKHTTDDNWKELSVMVFEQIVQTKADVFICLHINESTRNNRAMVHVSCCPVADANRIYTINEDGGVFNNLQRQMDQFGGADKLTQICKDVGMKLLDTPKWVFVNMIEAGIKDLTVISPEVVLKFFSFQKKSTRREPLHHERTELANTTLKSVGNVRSVLDYCIQSELFQDYANGLPLCLTSDLYLQEFTSLNPVFCTPYSHLLPSSKQLFLDFQLVVLFLRNSLQALPIFRQLDTGALSELLPLEMNFDHDIAICWDPNSPTIPNENWMKGLWECLYDNLKPVAALIQTQDEKENAFFQMMSPLSSKCLIPCTKKEDDIQKHYLIPVSKAKEILIVPTFTGNPKLLSALDKIQLHRLNQSAIPADMYSFLLANVLAVFERPQDVLKCLFLNHEAINDADLSNSDCISILEYFSDNLNEIVAMATDVQEVIHQLRSLPLFTCVQGTRIRLQTDLDVFIVKEGLFTIPAEGIEEWGNAVNIKLLRHRLGQTAIYRLLELEIKSACDIYSDVIFETFDHIPVEHREEHLIFIRDRLVPNQVLNPYNEEQKKLILALQELEFITLENGETKMASEFYSPHNAVIEIMFHPQDFPPKPYCEAEWLYFMELAGMKKEVTTELFIQFAKSVEMEGKVGITEDICVKSEVLVHHLFNRSDILNEGLLQQISDVDFIVPFTISDSLERIHEQMNSSRLICFSGSVFPDFQGFIWTTCSILPYYAMPFNYGFRSPSDRKMVIEQLGILTKPEFQDVLQHVQNICDNLQEKCQEDSESFDQSELLSLMDSVYDYLLRNGIEEEEMMKHRLTQKPIVFLPEQMSFITCDRIVIKIDEEDTLKPYLYAAPDEFGKFFKLFEMLGSKRKLCSDNYAKVLHYLHIDVGNDELDPNKLKVVRTSVHQMFRLLGTVDKELIEDQITVDVLYLPNRDKRLVDSSTLVYSDKQYLERYLDQDENIDWFAGFPQLEIPFPTGSHVISKLPTKYRPRILSEIIQQEFDLEMVEIIESDKASKLDRFVRSMEFIQGILRLIVDERQKDQAGASVDMTNHEKESLMSSLQNIHFYEVGDLKVKLIYEEAEVGQENVCCKVNNTVQGKVSSWDLYFCVGENENWLQVIEDSFTEMINNCLDDALGSNVKHVSKLLRCINHFEDIAEVLDKNDIVEFSLTSNDSLSFFPPTGTLIHPRWHHMLSNAFTSFDKGEYVAILVFEEEEIDDSDSMEPNFTDPVYIHAIVVEIMPFDENVPKDLANVMRKYKLDVGENTVEVFSAYRIYKYHRGNTLSESRELELAVNAPKVDVFDDSLLPDICEEIKQFLQSVWRLPEDEKRLIIKRLMRQWHPDKNIGNERFSSQVFDCIQKTKEKMELDDNQDVDGDTVDARHHRQHGWGQQVSVVIGRERQHQQQYNQQPTGFNLKPEPVANPANARRWYKQAGKDLAAAQKFIDIAGEVDGYNWVCYKCHQAAEKALKAVWFNIDANSNLIKSHDLIYIASQLDRELLEMAQSLTQLLGNHTGMRYPDKYRIPWTPSDIFTKEQAAKAIAIANDICEWVSSQL